MEVAVTQFDGVSTIDTLPLAAGILVASARRDRSLAETTRFSIHTARLAPEASAAACGHVDVLACSTYVWNERYSLEIARRVRSERPGTFVLFGGPSVPRQPDRAARFLREHPYVDALAFGEGETLFGDVLAALIHAQPLTTLAGLALRATARPEGAMVMPARDRIRDFSGAGSPYLDGTFDALWNDGVGHGAAILETNRGCPFTCTFCDWGQAIGTPVREIPIERVRAELAWIANRSIRYLYIIDANYGIRRRDLEIVEEIGRLKAATGFPTYVFFHLTKNATARHLELVSVLRNAGIGTHLALSAQDFEPRVLRAVRRDNISLDRALTIRRLCHERDIPTFNELILGLPEQTYASFVESMEHAVTAYPLDTFNLYLARVLENAELGSPEQRAQYGIQTEHVRVASFHRGAQPFPGAEVEEVVVGTRTLSQDDWRHAFKFGYLLVAVHSLRLLDIPIQVARRILGISVRDFMMALLRRLESASRSSAFGRIDAVLERYAAAVLDGETMVLPAQGTGNHLWAVEDAVLIEAVRNRAFFSETRSFVTQAFDAMPGSLLAEAVRYQRLVTPCYDAAARRRAAIGFDFGTWRSCPSSDSGLAVAAEPTRLRWSLHPNLANSKDLCGFVVAYLDAIHSRKPTGHLTVERSDGPRFEQTRRRRGANHAPQR